MTHQARPAEAKIGTLAQLEILGVEDHLLRAQWRNLYLMRWSGKCDISDLNLVFREISSLAQRNERIVVVSLLDSGCKPPSSEGRELAAKQHLQFGNRLVQAYLVDGQGFWASIILNALLGIQTNKSQRAGEERVFRDRHEACNWLKLHIPGGALAHDIERIITHCREVARAAA